MPIQTTCIQLMFLITLLVGVGAYLNIYIFKSFFFFKFKK